MSILATVAAYGQRVETRAAQRPRPDINWAAVAVALVSLPFTLLGVLAGLAMRLVFLAAGAAVVGYSMSAPPRPVRQRPGPRMPTNPAEQTVK